MVANAIKKLKEENSGHDSPPESRDDLVQRMNFIKVLRDVMRPGDQNSFNGWLRGHGWTVSE